MENIEAARNVFSEACAYLKSGEQKEERVLLVQTWKEFEDKIGDPDAQEKVAKLMPKRIKKKRQIKTEDGTSAGWEEYYDYLFPDEQTGLPAMKILERAHLWKAQQS